MILYCIMLLVHYIMFYYIILYFIILYYIILYYIILYYIQSYHIILYHILYYIILYYIILYYNGICMIDVWIGKRLLTSMGREPHDFCREVWNQRGSGPSCLVTRRQKQVLKAGDWPHGAKNVQFISWSKIF